MQQADVTGGMAGSVDDPQPTGNVEDLTVTQFLDTVDG